MTSNGRRVDNVIRYHTIEIDGVDIFYREAGPAAAPVILLLHGFPTSSHMFRDLIPLLADRFRLVAPDYPSFGYSGIPDLGAYDYTFDQLARTVEKFVDALSLQRYAIYMQDFGGPVGLRLAAARPERVTALIVQNANAYNAGLTPELRDIVRGLWRRDPLAIERVQPFFELPHTRRQFVEGAPDPDMVNPDSWHHAQWVMDRPGNRAIQLAIHADYYSNLELYDAWHAYFRDHHPPMLVTWGRHDFVFAEAGATAYAADLPDAEIHLLDAGHFALETHAGEIADRIRAFLSRSGRN